MTTDNLGRRNGIKTCSARGRPEGELLIVEIKILEVAFITSATGSRRKIRRAETHTGLVTLIVPSSQYTAHHHNGGGHRSFGVKPSAAPPASPRLRSAPTRDSHNSARCFIHLHVRRSHPPSYPSLSPFSIHGTHSLRPSAHSPLLPHSRLPTQLYPPHTTHPLPCLPPLGWGDTGFLIL